MAEAVIDQAGPVRQGEQLPAEKLSAYLLEQLPGKQGPLIIEQFPCGYSNLTYLLKLGPTELVLRRPPFGNPVKSAHDMGREYRVLSKLCEVYQPAPRPFLFCQDTDVIGDEFYVMQRRRGIVLRQGTTPTALRSDPTVVRGLCESFVENLAALHTLDYRTAGLGDVGRPAGYVQRQVDGWTKRYHSAQTDAYPAIEQLSEWLIANRPADRGAALIHNDYKYDNLLLDPTDLTRIVAVFDWEMATVGDPLMDLGTTLAYWVQAGDPQEEQARAFGPTMLPGSLSRGQLVQKYIEQTGFDVPEILFYYCFGLFKLAGIVQQIYARYVRGHTTDARFAELNRMVESLGKRGLQAIRSGEV